MTTKKIFDQITEILKNSDLSWLLPNLRQDAVIWNSLNDPKLLDKLLQNKAEGTKLSAEDFAPCKLALLALGDSNALAINSENVIELIDTQILQDALRRFSELIIQQPHPDYLVNAGYIALALVENYQNRNSWQSLLEHLPEGADRVWLTPISCLLGLVKDPKQLLIALVQPGAGSLRYKLAVHSVLSNPYTTKEQISILTDLFFGQYGDLLPTADRLRLIEEVQAQNPQLAVDLCSEWLLDHPLNPIQFDEANHDVQDTVDLIAEVNFDLRISELTDMSKDMSQYEKEAETLANAIFIDMINNIAGRKLKVNSSRFISPSQRFVTHPLREFANHNLPLGSKQRIQAEQAIALFHDGYLEEALKLLPSINEPLPDELDLLYAIAFVYHIIGNDQQSNKAASKILAFLVIEANHERVPMWGDYFSLVNLGNLLVELHEPSKAAQVFEFCTVDCPNDTNMLNILAECYKSANQVEKAADIYCALVALNPENIDFHRSLAESLAKNGQWEDCLKERDFIINSDGIKNEPQKLFDLYQYAKAAINASRPELAIIACQNILTSNPEDSQGIIYLGQAYINIGDADKGIDYLIQATRLSPQLEEAWLALAEAQKKKGQIKSVIDTLHNASLVLPYSAEILCCLGEAYMLNNSPTLANPVLQRALELTPDDPKILVRYGQSLKMLGEPDKACQVFAKAYNVGPDFPGLAQDYSNILLDLGRIEEAITPLDQLMSNKLITDPATYMDYARCVLMANKHGSTEHPPMKALIALNEVVQIAPEIVEAKALIAEVLNACGENELAYQAYRDALDTPMREDKGWFEKLSYGLGCTAKAIGKYDVAIAALQEAAETNPANPEIFMALSSAYLSADLSEDAVGEARNVLILDGENPDRLAWFAKQMTLVGLRHPNMLNASFGSKSTTVSTEITNALNKAIQLAPTRVDLVLRLADFQAGSGSKDEAKSTYASIASHAFVTVADLITAAERLSQLDDHTGAIICLEKALSFDQQNILTHISAIYKLLAQEYFDIGDQASALITLNIGIELIPEDISILSMKIQKLLEMESIDNALNCIENALSASKDHQQCLELIFLATRIYLSIGDLRSALQHVQMALPTTDQRNEPINYDTIPFPFRIQIAEIFFELLQPNQAYSIIEGDHPHNRDDFENDSNHIEYQLLRTDLILALSKNIDSSVPDLQLDPSNPFFRWYAFQKARVMCRLGDYRHAEELTVDLIENCREPKQINGVPKWEQPFYSYKQTIARCEAAFEIGKWEYATPLLQKMIDQEEKEPMPYLLAAKAMVLQAEYDQLSADLNIEKHKSINSYQNGSGLSDCMEFLNKSEELVLAVHGEKVIRENTANNEQISRWRMRAAIAYKDAQELHLDLEEILSHEPCADEVVPVISYLRRQMCLEHENDAISKIIKLARKYPHDPNVILHVAISLQDHSPEIAYRSLQSVVQENANKQSPTLAFCNIVLAMIGFSMQDYSTAESAVTTALNFWTDEPGWHELAAQIYIQTGDQARAINHLSEAATLAPEEERYHKQLGHLLLDQAYDDRNILYQALNQFESAFVLDNDDVDVLVDLATTQYLMSDVENANANARKALVISPDRADIYQLLSAIAVQNNDYQGAYEYANKAILIDPKDIQSTIVLARSLTALGRYHEAIAKLNSIIPETQKSELLYLERVNIVHKMAGVRAALNELVMLNNTYPDNFDILKTLAKMHVDAGENENAIAIAKQALDSSTQKPSPNDRANLHLLLGQLYRKSGQLELSIEHLSEAIRLAPDRLEPYLELGLARKERREYQQALQVFEQASSIAPDDPRALFQAGLALKESKDYKSSETMLRRAVSIAPNDLSIRRQLAAVVALNLVHNPRLGRS